jgi:hypothetical protein
MQHRGSNLPTHRDVAQHVALAQIPGLRMVKDLLCLAELIVITSKVCTNLTRLLFLS